MAGRSLYQTLLTVPTARIAEDRHQRRLAAIARNAATTGAKAASSQLSPYITRNSVPSWRQRVAQRAAGSKQLWTVVAVIHRNAELAAVSDKSLDLLAEIADAEDNARTRLHVSTIVIDQR